MESATNLRAKRSRKDRPCDHCRRLKHACRITVRGEPCENCVRGQRECTFAGPALPRLKVAAPVVSPQSTNDATDTLIDFLETLDESDDDEASSRQNTYFASLDTDTQEAEELHYLGAGVFSHSVIELPHASPLYRQVASSQHPVFFIRSPSRIYDSDNAITEASRTYVAVTQMLSAIDEGLPARLIKHFTDKVLPAFPILNAVRLEAACQAWSGGGPFPHALLVGIIAFSAVSDPACRNKCKLLWGHVVRLLEIEYRQPRLQTLQLALLDIGGRPVLNPGGNHMAIARAIGAAQLLGLHRDCSRWRLPSWEKAIRKRLWWTLYIQDKWNAFLFGRPSNIPPEQADIPLPTLRDDDWRGDNPLAPGIASFILSCRMAIILNSLLPIVERPQLAARAILQDAAQQLEAVNIPQNAGPGMNDLRLTKLGMEVLICRLAIESTLAISRTQLVLSTRKTVALVGRMTQFVSRLDMEAYKDYWSALGSSYQLLQSLSVLLRLATRIHRELPAETDLISDVLDEALKLSKATEAASESWQVAEAAMPQVRSLINSLSPALGSDELRAIGATNRTTQENAFPLEVQSWLDSFDFTGEELDVWLNQLLQGST